MGRLPDASGIAAGAQEAGLYGDSWTPLMAAAVAQHTGIAAQLLAAAGARAAELACASNRYGQGALHLAARQGCLPLIRLLLAAGAGAAVRPAAGRVRLTLRMRVATSQVQLRRV
jgi:ankyrin repeat protein